MAAFLKVLFRNLLEGPSTDPFPLAPTKMEPERLRGRVVVDEKLCMGCGICSHYCVAGAINIQHTDDGHTITIWHNACCRCAACRQYCPVGAISLIKDWHSAHEEADKYKVVEQKAIAYEPCSVCGKKIRPVPTQILKKLYVNNTDIDLEHVQHLCPACRQLEDARRSAGLPAAAEKAAVEQTTDANA
ncbi:MAG: hydrogenase [Desulfovibrionaceae bacterium]|nr:hydrogenase [Desulfovibrionaceae bacterium]